MQTLLTGFWAKFDKSIAMRRSHYIDLYTLHKLTNRSVYESSRETTK